MEKLHNFNVVVETLLLDVQILEESSIIAHGVRRLALPPIDLDLEYAMTRFQGECADRCLRTLSMMNID